MNQALNQKTPIHARASPSIHATVLSSVANASKLTLAMAITIPLGLVTRILIPRFLGVEKAGVFFFAESFPNIALMLLPFGISSYIQKNVPADHGHARIILKSVLVFQVFMAIFLILAVLGYMQLAGYEGYMIALTGIMAIYQAMLLIQSDVMVTMFIAVGRISLVAATNVISKIFLVFLVLVCLMLDHNNLYLLTMAFLSAQLFVLVYSLRKAQTFGMLGGTVSSDVFARVIKVSLPFFLAAAVSGSNSTIDVAVLSRMANFHEVGYYGAVMRIQGLLLMAVPLLSNALTPLLSVTYVRGRLEYRMLAAQAMRILIILAFGVCMASIAFAHEIIFAIYGPEFAPAAMTLCLNGPVILLTYVTVFLVNSIIITTNGRGLATILALGFCINFALDYFLVPVGMKLLGPGGGASASTLATMITEFITMCLLIRLSDHTVFNRRTTYTLCMLGTAALAFVGLSEHWAKIEFLPKLGLFVLVIPLFLAATRVLNWADIVYIRQLIANRRPLREV